MCFADDDRVQGRARRSPMRFDKAGDRAKAQPRHAATPAGRPRAPSSSLDHHRARLVVVDRQKPEDASADRLDQNGRRNPRRADARTRGLARLRRTVRGPPAPSAGRRMGGRRRRASPSSTRRCHACSSGAPALRFQRNKPQGSLVQVGVCLEGNQSAVKPACERVRVRERCGLTWLEAGTGMSNLVRISHVIINPPARR